jgi:DNA-binding response OmpR family regulator
MAHKILLAEDNKMFLKLLLHDLTSQGYEALGLSTGDEVIETFQSFKPDLVILDGLLPGKNGFDLAREIRSLPDGASIPIILLTGVYKEIEYYKYSKEIGIDLHYDKTKFDKVEFLEKVKGLVSG